MTIVKKAYRFVTPIPAYVARTTLSLFASAFRKASFFTRVFPFQLIEIWSVRPDKIARVVANPRNASGAFSKASTIATITPGETLIRKIKRQPCFAAVLPENLDVTAFAELPGGLREDTLLIGGTDSTFPLQIDVRFPTRSREEVKALEKALANKGAVYVENLTSFNPIFSPVPGGVLPTPWRGSVRLVRKTPLEKSAGKLVFCAHRTRKTSDQWETRRLVTKLAKGPWSSFVEIPSGRLELKEFRRQLSRHSFTLCVEGGGLDPSPKAFEALLQGSIPIIRESPLADAYRHLPVLVVPDWNKDVLAEEFLKGELSRLRGEWPDWSAVLDRLAATYWLDIINHRRPTRQHSSLVPPGLTNNQS